MEKVLEFAKTLISNKLKNGGVAVDATCGRGNDTLFLARLATKVYAFDIQPDAVNSTKNMVCTYEHVTVLNDSHENINKYVSEKIDAVMFNLGYLPNGDKTVTTKSSSTLKAIENLLPLLNDKGLITIVCYPGHPEGNIEAKELEAYLKTINQKEYDIIKYDFINQINNPPYLLAIEKR